MKNKILLEIIAKGGFIGDLAEGSLNNPSKGDQFILYCFDQSHNLNLWDIWGKELILDIVHFKINYLRLEFELLYPNK